MTNLRYESIWRILKENKFEISRATNEGLQCVICQNILINACNGPCGCRYCYDCITNFLNGEEKSCPGTSEECKEVLLNLNVNILTDQTANKKISKIMVNCPEKTCVFIDELIKIEDHIRVCSIEKIKCPYFIMGCSEDKIISEKMDEHLHAKSFEHTHLLTDWMENWKNEIESVKQKSDKKDIFISEILRINSSQSLEISELKQVMDNYKNEFDYLKQQLTDLKLDFDNKMVSVWELETSNEEQRNEIEQLKQSLQVVTTKQEILQKNSDFAIEPDIIEQFIQGMSTQVDSLKSKLSEIEMSLEISNYGEYVWRIDHFSEKSEASRNGTDFEIHSEPFYSHKNGYKMCLCVYPYGGGSGEGTHLSLGFSIMKGEFDEFLPWPMKHEVTFSLIDQESGEIYKSVQGNYYTTPIDNRCIFEQPKTDKNMCLSRPKFITLFEVLNNSALIKNDTIILKCLVNACKTT